MYVNPFELAALLAIFRDDLHVSYANASRRGRGIGGQALTAQCNYLDPEGHEHHVITAIDEAIKDWFQRAELVGIDMSKIRERILRAE